MVCFAALPAFEFPGTGQAAVGSAAVETHCLSVASTLDFQLQFSVGLVDEETTVIDHAVFAGECGSILIILYIGPHVAVRIPSGFTRLRANQTGFVFERRFVALEFVSDTLFGLHRALHYGYGS